jgi:hypothetical protein
MYGETTTAEKTVVTHRPDFLSYLGFFYRLCRAGGWTYQDKIKMHQGEGWMDHLDTAIRGIELAQPLGWHHKLFQ